MESDDVANLALETSLRSWLSAHLPSHASVLTDSSVSIFDALKSGVILCDMMNVIKPGSIKRISLINTAYKQLENVQNYLNMCRVLGMQGSQVFESSDLVNSKFKTSILINLKTLYGIHERFAKSPYSHSGTEAASLSSSSSGSTAGDSATLDVYAATPPATPSVSQPPPTSQPTEPIRSVSSTRLVSTYGSNRTSSVSSSTAVAVEIPLDSVVRNVINTKAEDKTVSLIVSWIEALLSTTKPTELTLFEWLKSGVVLLQMLNGIRPGVAKPIYEGSIGFKQIENVQRYLKLCPIVAGLEVPQFSVPDLTDDRDQSAVTSHLHALITIIQRAPSWTGPTLTSVHHNMKVASSSSASLDVPESASSTSITPIEAPATTATALPPIKPIEKPVVEIVPEIAPAPSQPTKTASHPVEKVNKPEPEPAKPIVQKEASAPAITSVPAVQPPVSAPSSSNAPQDHHSNVTSANKADDKTVSLIVSWIEALLSTTKPAELTLFEWLKSGVVLLQMLNGIRPGVAKPIYEGSIGFKQIENVQRYLKLCPIVAGLEVPQFSVPDLTDDRDQSAVTSHLHALITIIQRAPSWSGPTLASVHRASKLAAASQSAATASTTPADAPSASSSSPTPETSFSVTAPASEPTPTSLAPAENSTRSNLASIEASAPSTQAVHHHTAEVMTFEERAPHQVPPAGPKVEEIPTSTVASLTTASGSHRGMSTSSSSSSTISTASSDSGPQTPSTASQELSELEKARRELEAERAAMQEERRLFAEKMQAETEKKLKEMAAKLEFEAAARVADVVAAERRKSVAIASQLEEEKKARQEVSKKLDEERTSRIRLVEEAEHQKQDLASEAQKQLQAVAERLHEETSKRLEALASRITSEAMQKTEAELKKKDEHLMQQINRERVLRTRLDALEEEKKSLARTFERKFAALESELKASKTQSKPKVQHQLSSQQQQQQHLAPPNQQHGQQGSPAIQVHLASDSDGYSSASSVDAETLQAFKSWNSKWKANRRLTKQLTRTLSQFDSTTLNLSEDGSATSPLGLVTPHSEFELTEHPNEADDEEEHDSVVDLRGKKSSTTTEADDYSDDEGSSDEDRGDLDKKQWLDDDWSEEEDWESDDEDFDDFDAAQGHSHESHSHESHSPSTSKHHHHHHHVKPKTSPTKDEWSEFSDVNLSRFS